MRENDRCRAELFDDRRTLAAVAWLQPPAPVHGRVDEPFVEVHLPPLGARPLDAACEIAAAATNLGSPQWTDPDDAHVHPLATLVRLVGIRVAVGLPMRLVKPRNRNVG